MNLINYILITIIVTLSLVRCGEHVDEAVSPNRGGDTRTSQVDEVRGQVAYLQEVIGSLGSADNYTTCNATNLSQLEVTICQISQSATAEDRVEFVSQLGNLSKLLQVSLYGTDCAPDDTNAFLPGCPLASSILGQVNSHTTSIASLNTTVSSLSTSVTSLLTRMTTAESNISTLQGNVTSINSQISGINTSISSINTQISTINTTISSLQTTVHGSDLYKAVQLCANTTPTTGPLFEVDLLTSTHSYILAYVSSGGGKGLGIVRNGTDASLYTTTSLNTLACKVMIYTHLNPGANQLNVCWHNTNRSATQVQINAVCDPNNDGQITDKTSACTCAY